MIKLLELDSIRIPLTQTNYFYDYDKSLFEFLRCLLHSFPTDVSDLLRLRFSSHSVSVNNIRNGMRDKKFWIRDQSSKLRNSVGIHSIFGYLWQCLAKYLHIYADRMQIAYQWVHTSKTCDDSEY